MPCICQIYHCCFMLEMASITSSGNSEIRTGSPNSLRSTIIEWIKSSLSLMARLFKLVILVSQRDLLVLLCVCRRLWFPKLTDTASTLDDIMRLGITELLLLEWVVSFCLSKQWDKLQDSLSIIASKILFCFIIRLFPFHFILQPLKFTCV